MTGHNKTTCPRKEIIAAIPTFVPSFPEPAPVPVPAPPAPVPAPTPPRAPSPADRFASLKVGGFKQAELDVSRLIDNLFTKIFANRGSVVTLRLLKILYSKNKGDFKVTDGIHTDMEGNNAHISVRVYDGYGYDTIHFNGAMRNGMFIVKSGSYRNRGDVEEWFYDHPSERARV